MLVKLARPIKKSSPLAPLEFGLHDSRSVLSTFPSVGRKSKPTHTGERKSEKPGRVCHLCVPVVRLRPSFPFLNRPGTKAPEWVFGRFFKDTPITLASR